MTSVHRTSLTIGYVLGLGLSAAVLTWIMPVAVQRFDLLALMGFLLALPSFTVIGAAALALRGHTASVAFKYLSAGAGLWSALVYLALNAL